MPNQYLENKDIKGQNLATKTTAYMVDRFKQLGKLFSYSSSYGQIMLNISNHSKLVFFYIKDSINEMSFQTAKRKSSIFGMGQLQGHNAHRGFGATGAISIHLKKNGLFDVKQMSSVLYIPNFTRLRCAENGLLYYLNLGKEYVEYDVLRGAEMTFAINQGVMKTETFISDGSDNQTYSIPINNILVDMNHILVEVNGERYEVSESFSEFVYGVKKVVVRTGLTDGIDLIFGKSVYVTVPPAGSTIKVYYPVIAGRLGDVSSGVFTFVDPFYTLSGETVNVTATFDTTITAPIMFGSDPEDVETTRILAPNVNKNRIICDKKSTKYFFDKLGIFGEVKIFNDTQANIMETYIYPKLSDVVGGGKDYFSLTVDDIVIDQVVKDRLLESSNKIRSQNIDIIISDPTIRRYSMLIIVDVFKTDPNGYPVDLIKIKSAIRQAVSNKMVAFKRTNKIAKSDISKVIDDVESVDSVYVDFVVEDATMLDNIGNIVISDKEIALPSTNFVDANGNMVTSAISIEVKYA